MPRGTRWVLGGGNKKRALATMLDAANAETDFYIAVEARFALWDVYVRERRPADAVPFVRSLARDFPENREIVRFLAAHDSSAAGER
jgi:hypothetical protein